MSFPELMHSYFRGEKLEALLFILPIGLLMVGAGAALLKAQRDGFSWGVAIPTLVFGLIFLSTGAYVGGRTEGQVAVLDQQYAESPQALAAAELPRMRRVNHNFRLTLVVFGVLTALGAALVVTVSRDWVQGLGTAMCVAGALGLLFDGFASRRALPYTAALEALEAGEAPDAGTPQPPLNQRHHDPTMRPPLFRSPHRHGLRHLEPHLPARGHHGAQPALEKQQHPHHRPRGAGGHDRRRASGSGKRA